MKHSFENEFKICGILRNVKATCLKSFVSGFHGGTVVKNPPASSGDTGSSPGLGRSHMQWSN